MDMPVEAIPMHQSNHLVLGLISQFKSYRIQTTGIGISSGLDHPVGFLYCQQHSTLIPGSGFAFIGMDYSRNDVIFLKGWR